MKNEKWVIVLAPDPPYELHEFERCAPGRAQETKEAYEGEGRGWLVFIETGSAEFDQAGATRRLRELNDPEVRRKLVETNSN